MSRARKLSHYREAERLLGEGARLMSAITADVDHGKVTEQDAALFVPAAAVLASLAQGHALLALADSQTAPDDPPVDPSTGGRLQTIGSQR